MRSSNRKIVYLTLAIAVIFIIYAFYFTTTKSSSDDEVKILFIGIDGADWEMIGSLMEQGMLPNFERLIKSGASTKMNTNEKGGSAVYWTTIATGQHSKKHGIKGFVYDDPSTKEEEKIPYTSNMRKTKAFWNILSEMNISVGVVGWFITWPVEEVDGFMVSSYYGVKDTEQLTWKGTVYEDTPDMVYPDTLDDRIDSLIQIAKNRSYQDIRDIIKPSALKSTSLTLNEMKWAFVADEIYNEIGIDLYKEKRPRVFAVYFNGLDVVGHRFTSKSEKEQREIESKYGDVQRNYYLHMDSVVGQFINLSDRNTIIIVASDHGLMRGEHTNNGVFIISGPNIKENIFLERPINLTDVTPTMLYLMGLPVPEDMDGQVFKDVISKEYLDENEVVYIDSYGMREIAGVTPNRTQFDAEIVERLKSLGYLN